MHHYIKNGKPFQSESPLYYFGWVYGNGDAVFGMHGTEAEYEARREQDMKDENTIWRTHRLVKKELIQEEQP